MRRLLRAGRVRPTRRGWGVATAAVLCAVGAYTLGFPELLLPAGLAAGLVLVAFAFATVQRLGATVRRRFSPASVPEGGVTTVTLDLVAVGPFRLAEGTWRETLPWHGTREPTGRIPAAREGGRRASVEYELRAQRRGIAPIGPVRLSHLDPFGLVVFERPAGAADPLVVTPRVSALRTDGRIAGEGEGTAQLVHRLSTGGEDDLMTREYRSGDALRRVHWRASARYGELMVRQEEQRTFPEARLVLDTRAASYPDAREADGELESAGFEWAVRMAASLGMHLVERGFRVAVLETADGQLAQPGGDERASDSAYLDSLAAVRLVDSAVPAGSVPREDVRTEAAGPLFAVIGDPDARTLRWIAGLHHPFERAIAFLLPEARADVERALVAAGWACVRVRPEDDVAVAWAAARATESAAPRA